MSHCAVQLCCVKQHSSYLMYAVQLCCGKQLVSYLMYAVQLCCGKQHSSYLMYAVQLCCGKQHFSYLMSRVCRLLTRACVFVVYVVILGTFMIQGQLGQLGHKVFLQVKKDDDDGEI